MKIRRYGNNEAFEISETCRRQPGWWRKGGWGEEGEGEDYHGEHWPQRIDTAGINSSPMCGVCTCIMFYRKNAVVVAVVRRCS